MGNWAYKYIAVVFIMFSVIATCVIIKHVVTWDVWDAIDKNRTSYIEKYLDEGGDANLKRDLKGHKGSVEKGYTLLMAATKRNDLGVAEMLIKHGADVSAGNSRDRTPLHYAIRNGNIDMVRLLLDNGADVNYKFTTPYNILEVSILEGHPGIVKLLIDAGARITVYHLEEAENSAARWESLKKKADRDEIVKLLKSSQNKVSDSEPNGY